MLYWFDVLKLIYLLLLLGSNLENIPKTIKCTDSFDPVNWSLIIYSYEKGKKTLCKTYVHCNIFYKENIRNNIRRVK